MKCHRLGEKYSHGKNQQEQTHVWSVSQLSDFFSLELFIPVSPPTPPAFSLSSLPCSLSVHSGNFSFFPHLTQKNIHIIDHHYHYYQTACVDSYHHPWGAHSCWPRPPSCESRAVCNWVGAPLLRNLQQTDHTQDQYDSKRILVLGTERSLNTRANANVTSNIG